MHNDRWPSGVLSERISEMLKGRRLHSALFTTYNFDPSFFELEVLSLVFDQSFSQVTKVRLLQLEDALREVEHIAVYYDRYALSQDAEPARLDYRRIDVRRKHGVFHPKLVLLLVDELLETDSHPVTPSRSLIIACLSANLSRSGWWENVECAHVEEVRDKALSPNNVSFRRDLLALLRRIQACGSVDDDHRALETIRQFLIKRTAPSSHVKPKSNKRWNTRLFGGETKQNLADWLTGLRIGRRNWNLEIISPFYDSGGTGPIEEFTARIEPCETRVFLPCETDGTARVDAKTYEAVGVLKGVRWANLPTHITQRSGSGSAERLAPRGVHAKVYRLWKDSGEEIIITGSVNCTSSAHSHGGAGNLEAAFLVDLSDGRQGEKNKWWLQPLKVDAKRFVESSPSESDGMVRSPIGVSIRYQWDDRKTFVRVDKCKNPQVLGVKTLSGHKLFEIQPKIENQWFELGKFEAEAIEKVLCSSSFVSIHCSNNHWRVLIREENMAHRPSILSELSPDEIFEYWSLLSAEERAAFLERHAAINEKIEGIPVVSSEVEHGQEETMFTRFAAIFHAFGCLKRHITRALLDGRLAEAEMRLLGAKYDSLPELLKKLLERNDVDPVRVYISFLTAKQLRDSVSIEHKEFFQARKKLVRKLDGLIKQGIAQRDHIFPLTDKQGREFLDWFERMFLTELSHL